MVSPPPPSRGMPHSGKKGGRPMPGHTITFGKVELVSLNDGAPVRSPFMPFPEAAIEQWRKFPDLLDSNHQIRSGYGAMAVRSEGKLIVVDTGLQTPDGTLMDDMSRKGVDREAVDMVSITHCHPDHVSWNLTGGRPKPTTPAGARSPMLNPRCLAGPGTLSWTCWSPMEYWCPLATSQIPDLATLSGAKTGECGVGSKTGTAHD